jgi:endonuclease G
MGQLPEKSLLKTEKLVTEKPNGVHTRREEMLQSVNMNADGRLSFTLPLTISVQLGNKIVQRQPDSNLIPIETKTETAADVDAITPLLSEGFKPDTKYANRKGYDPFFLGMDVPLPVLSKQQEKLASINQRARDGEPETEFKYQHFSVVMNAKRKLAFFTAVNIDGGSVVKINRTTGKVTRGPEAIESELSEGREKWFDDPRIDDREVCHDDLYKDVPQMKQFQRGHLVKRTDPSWGTEAKALKGQADTFHFSNCSPQHAKFNPNTSRWAGLENWITDTGSKIFPRSASGTPGPLSATRISTHSPHSRVLATITASGRSRSACLALRKRFSRTWTS